MVPGDGWIGLVGGLFARLPGLQPIQPLEGKRQSASLNGIHVPCILTQRRNELINDFHMLRQPF